LGSALQSAGVASPLKAKPPSAGYSAQRDEERSASLVLFEWGHPRAPFVVCCGLYGELMTFGRVARRNGAV